VLKISVASVCHHSCLICRCLCVVISNQCLEGCLAHSSVVLRSLLVAHGIDAPHMRLEKVQPILQGGRGSMPEAVWMADVEPNGRQSPRPIKGHNARL
jgi:hypothetical protein